MIPHRFRPGFTLLELIVYVGITALVVVSLTNIMITVFETRERTETVSEVQQSGRFVFDRITASFLNATSFSITGDSRIELTMPADQLSPVVFSLNDNAVYTRTGNVQAYPLTSDMVSVDTLRFRTVTNSSVEVVLTISGPNEDVFTLQTTHTLRLP